MFRSDDLNSRLEGNDHLLLSRLTRARPLGGVVVGQVTNPVCKANLNISIQCGYREVLQVFVQVSRILKNYNNCTCIHVVNLRTTCTMQTTTLLMKQQRFSSFQLQDKFLSDKSSQLGFSIYCDTFCFYVVLVGLKNKNCCDNKQHILMKYWLKWCSAYVSFSQNLS